MDEPLASFPTKTGRCYLYADRLVLAREGAVGAATRMFVGQDEGRLLVVYGLLAALLLGAAVVSLNEGNYLYSVMYALQGLSLLYVIIRSRGNSAALVIARASIERMAYRPARPVLTRAYFEVFFREDGRLRKRLIPLPGSLTGGAEAAQQALAALHEAGWPVG